jgi:hypothetical protein
MIAMTAFSPFAGVIADAYTLQTVYLVAAGVLFIALALLLVIFYAAHRKTKKPSVLA